MILIKNNVGYACSKVPALRSRSLFNARYFRQASLCFTVDHNSPQLRFIPTDLSFYLQSPTLVYIRQRYQLLWAPTLQPAYSLQQVGNFNVIG